MEKNKHIKKAKDYIACAIEELKDVNDEDVSNVIIQLESIQLIEL